MITPPAGKMEVDSFVITEINIDEWASHVLYPVTTI
jgi:hypothetical protein